MFTTSTITVIVVAGAYSLFHSYQAIRIYREESRIRRAGASVFIDRHNAVPPTTEGTVDDVIQVEPLPSAVADSLNNGAPERPQFEVLPQNDETSRPAATSSAQQSLFHSFQGILSEESSDIIAPPAAEDLPVPEEDMFFGPATPILAQMLPESESRRDSQRQSLVAAGYHSRAAWWNFNSTRFVLAFLSLVAAGFWLLASTPQTELWALGCVVAGPLLMWGLPLLLVNSKAAERRIDIERGLPDVLDMLSMGVSQGLTVPASLNRIGVEIGTVHPALSRELAIVNQQAHVGTLNHALRKFSQRIDSPEVGSFTGLLMQADTTGTSIAQALADYSDSMRNSLRERADSQANAASFKLLFPTALCLMPAVFLFLLGPAIVDMSDFVNSTSRSLQQSRQEAIDTLEQQATAIPTENR